MITTAFLVASLLQNAAFAAPTHCTPAETVAFSCAVSATKVVSVCLAGSGHGAATALSYRFGPIGKPELVFPAEPADSLGRFRYAHYFRYQVDRSELSFENAGVPYAVFDYYEGEGAPTRLRGVRVGPDATERELKCRGPVVSKLPLLEPLVPCDAESALASCR